MHAAAERLFPPFFENNISKFFNLCQTEHAKVLAMYSGESLFPNICGLKIVIVFFWLKWAGYLAVAGLNLLAQISDRISPFGV